MAGQGWRRSRGSKARSGTESAEPELPRRPGAFGRRRRGGEPDFEATRCPGSKRHTSPVWPVQDRRAIGACEVVVRSASPHLLNLANLRISIVRLQRVFSLTTNDRRLKTDDRSLTFTDMVESNCRVARTS